MFEKAKARKELTKQKERFSKLTEEFKHEIGQRHRVDEWLELYESYVMDFTKAANETDLMMLEKGGMAGQYNKLIEKFIKDNALTLNSFFQIKDNAYFECENLDESNEVFKCRVERVANFFGEDFMRQKLYSDPNFLLSVFNAVHPAITVEEAVNERSTDMRRTKVLYGHPIAVNNGLFNSNLPHIIERMLKQQFSDLYIAS